MLFCCLFCKLNRWNPQNIPELLIVSRVGRSGAPRETIADYLSTQDYILGNPSLLICIAIISTVSPRFLVTPKNPTEATEGEVLIIDCRAEGDPVPTISWDRNSIMNGFDPHRFRILENGSLLITQVLQDDEGIYACTAGNSGGLRREEVSLIVRRGATTILRDFAYGI